MYLRRLVKIELTHAAREVFGPDIPEVEVTFPRDAAHGDYATNFPLKTARQLGKPPMDVAAALAEGLRNRAKFTKVEAARPGFVNLFLSESFLADLLETLAGRDTLFSHYQISPGRKINIEFVSANPTGPLTVGHGRNACIGDGLARMFQAIGHTVTREYYFNNAGRQMKILAESLRARVLEVLGQPAAFPEEGYVGEYIRDIARETAEAGVSVAAQPLEFFQRRAEENIFKMIRESLDRLGIRFDAYFNEDRLYTNGAVQAVLARLSEKGLTYEKDGAVWFKGESLGLPKDPVLVKKGGEPTYRLPDIAYHIEKLSRGDDQLIDVLGADHIDEHREVLVILQALGHPTDRIRGIIYQFVTLVRGGKPVKMSTRRAEYVTLDELLDEVGPDVARFFFMSRKSDTHLEFDIELAKRESQENPVYYVQYAHARLAGIFRTAEEAGMPEGDIARSPVDLSHPAALVLAKKILSLGDVLDACSADFEVTGLLTHLKELAETFHVFYAEVRIVDSEDRPGSLSRLKLCGVVQKVLREVLTTLGISAPERM